MAGNAGYTIAAGASNLPPQYSAFAIETSLRQDWEGIWCRASPLIAAIKDGKANWNRKGLKKGTMLLYPVNHAASTTVVAAMSAYSDEFTALTPERSTGFTQAAYMISQYKGAFWTTPSEREQINNERGDYYAGRVKQKRDEFMNLIATHASGASAETMGQVMGVQYAIAIANTVGGIAQGTDTDWQGALVNSSYGGFNLDLFDTAEGAIVTRNGTPTLGLMAYSSSNDLFAKAKAQIGQAQRIVDDGWEARFGFKSMIYSGIRLMRDNRLTAGVICVLDGSTWDYVGDDRPKQREVVRVQGTGLEEHYLDMFCAIGCSNPSKNAKFGGVT